MVSAKAVKRSTWLGIIICAVFAVLLLRILFIQTVKFKEYQDKVLSQITTETKIPATRGNIYDRNGNILASNVVTYRVFISPSGIKNATDNRKEGDERDFRALVSDGLSEILGVDKSFVLEQIDNYQNKLDRTIQKKVDKKTAEKVNQYIAEGMTKKEAEAETGKSTAIPGHSEHQTGLAVDLNGSDETYAWLAEHCWDYGFILRYPEGKTEITGIIYEPWHFRYVGTELALELKEQGVTMEEYFHQLTPKTEEQSAQ